MKKFKIITKHKKMLADTVTPVSIYLRLRDQFPNSLLLESSDYHSREDCLSFICCSPIAGLKAHNKKVQYQFPDNVFEEYDLTVAENFSFYLNKFIGLFDLPDNEFKFLSNGLFGYTTFDAVQYLEDIEFTNKKNKQKSITEALYHVYNIVIVIDHFKNELYLIEHQIEGFETNNNLSEKLERIIKNRNNNTFSFKATGSETSNMSDDDFVKLVDKGKEHCFAGDVFQMVLSRSFKQQFSGDEFNVYRALRAINPSPYLFYFDYGSYKLFGSSPEAHLIINNKRAEIHPIAGTYKRTGNEEKDKELAEALMKDEKENAEHVMLVDLARNDLSVHSDNVQVETYREIQRFSHVIHLVSKVTGEVKTVEDGLNLIGSTFPAGTLSGAPKYKALQLIDQYENENRSFYGGAIGIVGFDGSFNHAIIIRSFLSKNNQLTYQAGAGVVSESNSEMEMQEVHNKIAALRNAIKLAEEI